MSQTLHVVSLPHTTLTEKHATCAYSMKVLKFVPMMMAQGFRVILYGPDEIDCEPDEHIVISTQDDRERWGFGDGFNTAATPFLWDAGQPYWFETATRATDAIRERIDPHDFICLITSTQAAIPDAISGPKWNNPITVEWGVGYEGIDTRSFHAFESYAWMHHVYGIYAGTQPGDWRAGHAFDAVIPNFFDVSQFPEEENPDGDYLFFIGRLIERKGPHIAGEIAKRLGMPLKIAGPGVEKIEPGKITGVGGIEITGDVEYVGEVGFAERAELMSNAACVLAPTVYIEPFGGVAVEAMLAGTPVVASDWGSFTEIININVGARFRTLAQGAAAVQYAQRLDRGAIRAHAHNHYSLEAVGPQFRRWFDTLSSLWGKGWYA